MFSHDAMNLNGYSQEESRISKCLARHLHQYVYVPENYICPEACALLAAAEELAVCSAETSETSERVDASILMQTMRVGLDGKYAPWRISQSTAPPKKFFRTFWRSITWRLLQRTGVKIALSRMVERLPVQEGML
jgi:hypothetical protein